MITILIVEDNPDINQILKDILQTEYYCIQAYSAEQAFFYLKTQAIDLMLLDIMLPDQNGDKVLQEVRLTNPLPIIILTALTDKKTTTKFLLDGANDYITKPFNAEEVKARITVQLRQLAQNSPQEQILTYQDSPQEQLLTYQDLSLNPMNFTVSTPTGEVLFRKREFDILQLLFLHPNQIFTKEKLYTSIWQEQYFSTDNTLNAHLSNLRKKLATISPETDYLETIWGLGIRLKAVKK